jgi:hypothetical protein
VSILFRKPTAALAQRHAPCTILSGSDGSKTIRAERHNFAMPDLGHALGNVGRWLWQRVETFPIPIEDAKWVKTYGNLDAAEHVSALRIRPRHVASSR